MKFHYPKLVPVYTIEINLADGHSVVHDFYSFNVNSDAGNVTSIQWTEYKYSLMTVQLSSVRSVRTIATKRRIRWVNF